MSRQALREDFQVEAGLRFRDEFDRADVIEELEERNRQGRLSEEALKAAIDRTNTTVEHIDVDASHLGMVFNQYIWNITLDAIDRTVGR